MVVILVWFYIYDSLSKLNSDIKTLKDKGNNLQLKIIRIQGMQCDVTCIHYIVNTVTKLNTH